MALAALSNTVFVPAAATIEVVNEEEVDPIRLQKEPSVEEEKKAASSPTGSEEAASDPAHVA